MADDVMTCPGCEGTGEGGLGFVDRWVGDDLVGSVEPMPCSLCDGAGARPVEFFKDRMRWRDEGRDVREYRAKTLQISLREGARRLGLSMSELSSVEHGRAPAPEGWRERLAEESAGG